MDPHLHPAGLSIVKTDLDLIATFLRIVRIRLKIDFLFFRHTLPFSFIKRPIRRMAAWIKL